MPWRYLKPGKNTLTLKLQNALLAEVMPVYFLGNFLVDH